MYKICLRLRTALLGLYKLKCENAFYDKVLWNSVGRLVVRKLSYEYDA